METYASTQDTETERDIVNRLARKRKELEYELAQVQKEITVREKAFVPVSNPPMLPTSTITRILPVDLFDNEDDNQYIPVSPPIPSSQPILPSSPPTVEIVSSSQPLPPLSKKSLSSRRTNKSSKSNKEIKDNNTDDIKCKNTFLEFFQIKKISSFKRVEDSAIITEYLGTSELSNIHSLDMVDHIRVYTDGSCNPNPGHGSWLALMLLMTVKENVHDDNTDIISLGDHCIYGSDSISTNNRMELMATVRVLAFVKENIQKMPKCNTMFINTDSEYVQKGITEWMQDWVANDWNKSNKSNKDNKSNKRSKKSEPVKNMDLWKSLYDIMLKYPLNVHWLWVKGHSTNKYNNLADSMVRKYNTVSRTINVTTD